MFANDGFIIRGWDETGLHVGSARRFWRLYRHAWYRGCRCGPEASSDVFKALPHPLYSAEEKTRSTPIHGLSFKYRSVLPPAFQAGPWPRLWTV